MKKLRKIVSLITGVVMAFSAFSFNTVSAEEETKLYTLEELWSMNEKDFLALDDRAFEFYDNIKSDAEYFEQIFDITEYGGISGDIYTNLYLEDDEIEYTANITESEISELLGDMVEYEINSPISLDIEALLENNLFYSNIFWISFPEYNIDAETNNITDETILEFAKCCYCVNQVIDIYYSGYEDDLYVVPSDEQILTGDVNVDKTTDVFDAVYIAKDTVGEIEFTDLQKQIGDVNSDSEIDVFDAIAIAKETVK